MELVILKQAEKELRKAPKEVLVDIYSLFQDLMGGLSLSMPISRPLFSLARGLFELRLSSRSGEFRVFYIVRAADAIYVLHACQKKTQKLDNKVKKLLASRIRSLNL